MSDTNIVYPSFGGSGGQNPPTEPPDMERRVAALETKVDSIKDILAEIKTAIALSDAKSAANSAEIFSKLDLRLNTIETTTAKASALSAADTRLAVLEERTTKLATARGVAGMLALATAVMALLANWGHFLSYITTGHF